ncbi:hypothetical protein [Ideonella sp.]|uniref:hypothetical protein n=1 Tax=Ideonella sp. TaxID=1929293 RepID=UPI0035AF3439
MIRVASALLVALTLSACGGSDGTTDLGDNADIAVNTSGPVEIYAGENASYVVSVANEGPATASDVALSYHLDGAATLGAVTCAATGSAECPATLGPAMTLSRLPAGGGLVFRVEVASLADQIGPVTLSMTATSADDENHVNNRDESTTIAMDLRNGAYAVYASNGRQYTLTLDFNRMAYAMVGAQVNHTGAFTPDADGVGFVFDGTARFRVAPDLVVGGFDFNLPPTDLHPYDHGVRPFIAARRFATDISALKDTSFNLLGLDLQRNDKLVSAAAPSTFGDGVLHSCLAPVPVRVGSCPSEFLGTYGLTVQGNEVVGVDEARHDLIHFRLAQSGSSLILLRAEDAADSTGRQFRVGLADTTGLVGGTFATSSTTSAWGKTVLTDAHYAFAGTLTGGSAVSETANLAPLTNVGPTGLRRGNRSSDGAMLYLGQNDALMLTLGAAEGLAEGMMDIGLR